MQRNAAHPATIGMKINSLPCVNMTSVCRYTFTHFHFSSKLRCNMWFIVIKLARTNSSRNQPSVGATIGVYVLHETRNSLEIQKAQTALSLKFVRSSSLCSARWSTMNCVSIWRSFCKVSNVNKHDGGHRIGGICFSSLKFRHVSREVGPYLVGQSPKHADGILVNRPDRFARDLKHWRR